MTEFSSLGEI